MYGKRIRELRKKAGLSQAELAELTGVSRPNISFWEKAAYPPLEAIDRVCHALEMETWSFFIDEEFLAIKLNLPKKYIALLQMLATLDDEMGDDLYEIFETILVKYQKLEAPVTGRTEGRRKRKKLTTVEESDKVISFDSYRLNFFARNAGNIALERYMKRLSWI